jgi:ELWxxDGT repeat protein
MRFTDTLEPRLLLAATFVHDLDDSGLSSRPSSMVAVDGVVYFGAFDPRTEQSQLWKSDGTSADTVLLKAFDRQVNPLDLHPFEYGDKIYFRGYDEDRGYDLWRTDRTPQGTVEFASVEPEHDPQFTVFRGELFFAAHTGGGRGALWKTDGTVAGTRQVKDISPGVQEGVRALRVVGDTLYAIAATPETGMELWRSDGTTAGTTLVEDINPGSGDGVYVFSGLDAVNGQLIFAGSTPERGRELWRSDGTAAGTEIVHEFVPGPGHGAPTRFTRVGDAVYFSVGVSKQTLWRTDGTAPGTELVFAPDPTLPTAAISKVASAGNKLFFSLGYQKDSKAINELWTFDGTPASATRLASFSNSGVTPIKHMVDFDGKLLVFLFDGIDPAGDLWESDGTPQGTRPVASIGTTGGANAGDFAVTDAFVFFVGNTHEHGFEPWRTDGTPEGTVLVKDLAPGTFGSGPLRIVEVAGVAYVTSSGGTWKSDGTPEGTVRILGGAGDESTVFDDRLYFVVWEGLHWESLWRVDGVDEATLLARTDFAGNIGGPTALLDGVALVVNDGRLWSTDGTPSGTRKVGEVTPDFYPPVHRPWARLGDGAALFAGHDPARGMELWRSDGTPAGTWLVRDLLPGPDGSAPSGFVELDGRVYFAASDGSSAVLWSSDGTDAGTTPVRSLEAAPATGRVTTLERLADAIVFTLEDRETGQRQLWRSDGTAGETYQLKDAIGPGPLFVSGGVAYFTRGAAGAWELWATDGTADGTRRLATFVGTNAPTGLARSGGGVVVFAADDAATGSEPWFTDGTPQGTRLLADVFPGPNGSDPSDMTAYGGRVYFAATHPAAGRELFVTDGTPSGTGLDSDVRPGGGGSTPRALSVVNGILFFAADDGLHGEELWKVGHRGGMIVGTAGDDHYTVRLEPGSQTVEFLNDDTRDSFTVPLDELDAIHFEGAGGDDTLVIDTTDGSPLPGRGLFFHGGTGVNELRFDGTTDGGVGRIQIDDGEIRITSDLFDADLVIGGDASVRIEHDLRLKALTVETSARATLAAASLHTRRLVLRGEGRLDLGAGSLIVTEATPAAADARARELSRHVRDGRLTRSSPAQRTALGVFDGRPSASAVLVRSVVNGDANADGRINADDYFRIDEGFLAQPADPLYTQGDFNYDGRVNADDYFLIDQAFLGQGATLTNDIAIASTIGVSAAAAAASVPAERQEQVVRKRAVRLLFSDEPVIATRASRRAVSGRRR